MLITGFCNFDSAYIIVLLLMKLSEFRGPERATIVVFCRRKQ